MSSTTNDVAQSYWNWAVLIGLLLTWNAFPFILHKFEVGITNPAQVTFSALIAVLAYLLLRGDRRKRIDWLFFLPFICAAVHFALMIIDVTFAPWKFMLQVWYVLLLLSYFVTVGLCVAVKAGVKRAARWTVGVVRNK